MNLSIELSQENEIPLAYVLYAGGIHEALKALPHTPIEQQSLRDVQWLAMLVYRCAITSTELEAIDEYVAAYDGIASYMQAGDIASVDEAHKQCCHSEIAGSMLKTFQRDTVAEIAQSISDTIHLFEKSIRDVSELEAFQAVTRLYFTAYFGTGTA